MDLRTRLLLGATAFAVIGYVGLIYGGCALDPRCHLRPCTQTSKYVCGVIYEPEPTPRTR